MERIDEVDILIVEDNVNDAEMALRAFKKNNLANNIYIVGDGEEALDFIFSRSDYENRKNCKFPKLILLDLKLPKVSGLEVLREIKSNEEAKVIPVIMLTSSNEQRDIIESYKLGVNSYIVKPVDFEKFVESVKDLGLYWLLLNKTP